MESAYSCRTPMSSAHASTAAHGSRGTYRCYCPPARRYGSRWDWSPACTHRGPTDRVLVCELVPCCGGLVVHLVDPGLAAAAASAVAIGDNVQLAAEEARLGR